MGQGRRSQPLPRNWRRIRQRVMHRDQGICHVCGGPEADQVDHIVPASDGGSDELDNLAPIHAEPCHASKTGREARAARKPQATKRRRPEPHPGLRPAPDDGPPAPGG